MSLVIDAAAATGSPSDFADMFAAGLTMIIVILGGTQVLGPRCTKYHLTENGIEVRLFAKILLWHCQYVDVTEIRVIPFLRIFAGAQLFLANRPFARFFVLLRTKRGLIRSLIISPDNPHAFVEKFQKNFRTLLPRELR